MSASQYASAALAFFIIWFVCIAICHFLPTGYDPIQNAVSDYGSHPTSRPLGLVAWWSTAIGAILLGVAFIDVFNTYTPNNYPNTAEAGYILLFVFAAARIGTSLFIVKVRVNPPAYQVDMTEEAQHNLRIKSIFHVIFALISFVTIPAASNELAKAIIAGNIPMSQASQNALQYLGYIEIAGLLLMVVSRRAQCFGLGERIFYLTFFSWLYCASISIIQL